MSNEPWDEPIEPSYSEAWGDESTVDSDGVDGVTDDENLIDSMDSTEAEAIEAYNEAEDEPHEESLMLDFDYAAFDGASIEPDEEGDDSEPDGDYRVSYYDSLDGDDYDYDYIDTDDY
ncbi:hypothetical protein DKL61_07015 [Gammaproteobacteria bacterium ESL0073]|nr:hypothetical protein DKL61_06900 [Gammaproteobacteria bacterium ESL0073]AWM80115.1 hypothetical protein DKL61_06960 [Gammaproteobacteria bacterium ESL0073]AWM80125.1 hypothetical protein DKL61_07015 [Gammaproteobacteria bacterium ESL0073]